MLQSMYNAMVNSPSAKLANVITDTETYIVIDDVSKLPPAPNLATIGVGETAETIRYTALDTVTNTLTVERGFQGIAQSWPQGTQIARFFTAYDHNTFKENIEKNATDIAGIDSAKVNIIDYKAPEELATAYPDGVSMFHLDDMRQEGYDWANALELSAMPQSLLVKTVKASTGGLFFCLQEVIFKEGNSIATYQRSTMSINMWTDSWKRVLDKVEINTRQLENIGYGVQSGLDVLASATPDMNVHVQAGVIYMPNGERFSFDTVTDVVINAADSTNPRKDVIIINSSGSIIYKVGTPSVTPTEPYVSTTETKICVIDVPAGDTTIEQTQLYDNRIFKGNLPDLQQQVNNHSAESVTQMLTITRDLSLTGIQSISTLPNRQIRAIKLFGVVIGSKKMMNGGISLPGGIVSCLYTMNDTGNFSYTSSFPIVFSDVGSVDRNFGAIQNITKNGFDINWTKNGNGATGTANLTALVIYHD